MLHIIEKELIIILLLIKDVIIAVDGGIIVQ